MEDDKKKSLTQPHMQRTHQPLLFTLQAFILNAKCNEGIHCFDPTTEIILKHQIYATKKEECVVCTHTVHMDA